MLSSFPVASGPDGRPLCGTLQTFKSGVENTDVGHRERRGHCGLCHYVVYWDLVPGPFHLCDTVHFFPRSAFLT